ncbi:MAG: diguanylate cyclase [Geobacteraceae bacterium]|nr:diguanylate cyclase [Geobacteraceae bacterium]
MDGTSILIIDDDPGLRKTLADILRAKGHDPLTAGSGGEGIALVQERHVNLVLIDLGLPDLTGIEVLDMVKSARPATEAIILTGNATLDSAIEATNRGAFSYLQKPYDIEQLLLHIQRALEKQRAEEQILRHGAELERTNAELKALYEVSVVLSRSFDMHELLSEVMQALAGAGIFPFEIRGAIFLMEGGKLHLASFISVSETMLTPCENIRMGECLCGTAAATGEIGIVGNFIEDGRHPRCNPGMAPYGRIIVPLKANDAVVGLLSLYTEPDVEVTGEMVKLLSSIGGQVGVAISNARLYEETKSSSLHDPLTGLANRRFLEVQLEKCIESARRYDRPLSVIMLDIDHFKRYNDSHGHVEGDRLLARIAAILLKDMRNADHVFRYGGEEFLAILPDTGAAMASEAAERLRKAVEAEAGVTISLGVASYRKTMEDKESLIRSADEALYRAKGSGRNRVELAG